MILEINDTRTVQDIQNEFSARFPYLKLEFFRSPHKREEPSEEDPCLPDQKLGEIREVHIRGALLINPGSETGTVEQDFERRFGLHVQIYRLQADSWIQTVGTDMMTLSEQNEIAKDSAIFYNPNHHIDHGPDED